MQFHRVGDRHTTQRLLLKEEREADLPPVFWAGCTALGKMGWLLTVATLDV